MPSADDRHSRSRRELVEPRTRRPEFRSGLLLVVVMAPALAAVWTVPWFVTQDGPAHVYNAQVLAWSFDPGSPFRDVYTIRWQPIPNWIGHLALAALVASVPSWVADRILISMTFVAFAGVIFWLRRTRRRVRQHRTGAALLAVLLAMNITWLFGFYGFLLGACLFPITLGYWWPHRDDPGPAGSWDYRCCWSSATSVTW